MEDRGGGKSILDQIPQIFMGFKGVYMILSFAYKTRVSH